MTPVEELRSAAAKLREMAKAATPGKWAVVRDDVGGGRFCTGVWSQMGLVGGQYVTEEIYSREADAAWIALMGPAKAESLAAWLEAEAACQEAITNDVESQILARVLDAIAGRETGAELTTSYDVGPQALAFARSILGEAA